MKILFVDNDRNQLRRFKKLFNGDYKLDLFDFRKSVSRAIGRLIRGYKYLLIIVGYQWAVNGFTKLIKDLSPSTKILMYSHLLHLIQDLSLTTLMIPYGILSIRLKLNQNGVCKR